MSTFITRMDEGGDGPRLAVKDLIDVEGVPTTAACRAVAESAEPATADAPLMAGARAAGVRIVGKANLHELALGATGVNLAFGTPVNPLDTGRVPGGSSSGSAVAVATHEADVAYGSDTAGSVRFPSACCGTTGLKTTHGRVSLDGVWPLAPSLDTIGPMARDVAGVELGMRLLEPGFEVADRGPTVVGRLRMPDVDPAIDAALDQALAATEWRVEDVDLPGWWDAVGAATTVLLAEAAEADGYLLEDGADKLGEDVAGLLTMARGTTAEAAAAARQRAQAWREELAQALTRVELIALPTLPTMPALLDDADAFGLAVVPHTVAVNLSGNPALALPVPTDGPLPASLQLVGPLDGEDLLLAAGRVVEAAIAAA